ncbi:class I SAM-dependent methyltransferase [Alphaproteobacteria bacterium]|nr:class I SAM-dependent methyltransferase [Alphaproteobacteria bacterium]
MNYEVITEKPGDAANLEQLEIFFTRYNWSLSFAKNKRILEVGCGSGIALNKLVSAAKYVEAWDVEKSNIELAKTINNDLPSSKINFYKKSVDELANIKPHFFDIIISFECIYYFPEVSKFFKDCNNILPSGGKVLISSVNPEWHSFNPSFSSNSYFDCATLSKIASSNGFKVREYFSFEDKLNTLSSYIIFTLKFFAVKMNLVPKSMKGKRFLKKLFLGSNSSLPNDIFSIGLKARPFVLSKKVIDPSKYKMIYLECTKI